MGLFPLFTILPISRWICSEVMEAAGSSIRLGKDVFWRRLYSAAVEGEITPSRDSIYFRYASFRVMVEAAFSGAFRPCLMAMASAMASSLVSRVMDTSCPLTRTRQAHEPLGSFRAVGVWAVFLLRCSRTCRVPHHLQ